MRRALTILLMLTAVFGLRARSLQSVYDAIDNGRGSAIEGIWRLTASGATIAVTARPDMPNGYDVLLLDGSDPAVKPYTVIGQAVEGAEAGHYDMQLHSRPGDLRSRKQQFIVSPVEGRSATRMRLSAYKTGFRISFWRLIPYLYRVSVERQNNRPTDHDGMQRLYPPMPAETIVL